MEHSLILTQTGYTAGMDFVLILILMEHSLMARVMLALGAFGVLILILMEHSLIRHSNNYQSP